jgi:hypothetical protein
MIPEEMNEAIARIKHQRGEKSKMQKRFWIVRIYKGKVLFNDQVDKKRAPD